MKRINKNWIKTNRDDIDEVVEVKENEIKEETKMSFFSKHKDKFIIGALTCTVPIIAVLLIVAKMGSSDGDKETDNDEIVDQDAISEFETGNVVNF